MLEPDRGGAALPPKVVALMALLTAAWGLNMVAVKVGNAGFPPVLQAALRSAIAAVLLWAWCHWRRVPLTDWRRPGMLAPTLLIGTVFAVEFITLYIGLTLTTAARAVVFLYAAPFFVTLGVHFLLPDDRLTPAKAAGLAIAFAGLALAFADRAGGGSLPGDLLALAAGALWAATTLMAKVTRLRETRAEFVLQAQLVVSAPLLLAASPLLDVGHAWAPTPLAVGALLYQAVGVAFASYLAWYGLVVRYPASRLAAFSVLAPLWGVAAGALLLGETVGPFFVLAVALVAAGLFLVNRPGAQPMPSTSTPASAAALASARSSVASGNRRRSASSR